MVKGDNDAYLYHLGDEFSKTFDFHQGLVHVYAHDRLFTSQFKIFMSLKLKLQVLNSQ
jgi:hypothetical protein